MTLIERLRMNPKIERIESDGHGYCIYLKHGWRNAWGGPVIPVHAIHEDTIEDAYWIFKHGVKECRCENCGINMTYERRTDS